MFVRGEDLDTVLRDTFEQCLNVPLNISMILIFTLEETRGAFNYFKTKKWFAHI